MWKNVFDGLSGDSLDNESGYDSNIYYESECCGNVLERDIYDSIAEYQRLDEWDLIKAGRNSPAFLFVRY